MPIGIHTQVTESQLKETAFLQDKKRICASHSAPSPSSILHCLLQVNEASSGPSKLVPSSSPSELLIAHNATSSRLMQRGLQRKDAVASRMKANSANGQLHWTNRTLSQMSSVSWESFRHDIGVEVEVFSKRVTEESRGVSKHFVHPVPPIRCWGEAELSGAIRQAVSELFPFPTAIQSQCVPALLYRAPEGGHGIDVLASAETGGGKTGSYLIPALHEIAANCPNLLGDDERMSMGPFVLVVVLTRELAGQVYRQAETLLLKGREVESRAGLQADGHVQNNPFGVIRIVKVTGGESADWHHDQLSRGAHMVVGTVGQLETLLKTQRLSLGNTRMVVVDEVDRMLEGSQKQCLDFVLGRVPAEHQTALFTATLTAGCSAAAQKYLSPTSGYYIVRSSLRFSCVTQCFELVPIARQDKKSHTERETESSETSVHKQKISRLCSWLMHARPPVIVFANERRTCDELRDALMHEASEMKDSLQNWAGEVPSGLQCPAAAGTLAKSPSLTNLLSATVVHSDQSQPERQRLLTAFQSGTYKVLITTDLLARGLDVKGVSLVFNYDLPWPVYANDGRRTGREEEEALGQYIHRIGRTGRAGEKGVSVSLVSIPERLTLRGDEVVGVQTDLSADESESDEEPQLTSDAASATRKRDRTDVEEAGDLPLLPALWDFLLTVTERNGGGNARQRLRENTCCQVHMPTGLAKILESAAGRGGSAHGSIVL